MWPGEGVGTEAEIKPMHKSLGPPWRMHQSPRCGARTRSGRPCRSPAVRGKERCRMPGGAKGSGAPEGKRNGRYRHGAFTREALEARRLLARLIRQAREQLRTF